MYFIQRGAVRVYATLPNSQARLPLRTLASPRRVATCRMRSDVSTPRVSTLE